MVFELLGSPDVSAQSLHTAMKTHVHRAENGCAVFHGARDESRPEAVPTELGRIETSGPDVSLDDLSDAERRERLEEQPPAPLRLLLPKFQIYSRECCAKGCWDPYL